ncbi:MAG TPA: L-seryl-tRNA(Sec) selenium transferase [Hyphomicrobiaceae bacterium]|jgi:L-seryl-tRNA(Ser) seleniumtransferase
MNQALPISPTRLPSVERVLRTDVGAAAIARFGHEATVDAVRRVLDQVRQARGSAIIALPDKRAVAAEALELLEREHAPSVRRVFNLSGIVLHTNLGRAVLPEAAIEAAIMAMRQPVALEFDVGSGKRGERDDHVRGLICELTGAEDAAIVNNNAGAVLLVLNTLAAGNDAIVSRGELIEIGGSFRLPDIMARAGARLVEVGTTNRTHLRDYEQAIGQHTGLILKAHTSNYLIQGFTKAVPASELAALARRHNLPFVNDLGSGALVDLSRYGLRPEPTVRETLSEGADLVTFSGDKLLGGPQAGIIAGRKDLLERVRKNPMKRALRIDKIRLAALEAVLKLYRDPGRLHETLPTLKSFVRPQKDIEVAATRLLGPISAAVGSTYDVGIIECSSQIGSGALPLETLPSAGIAMTPADRKGAGTRLEALAAAFRALPIPVIGHIRKGAFVIDIRCLEDEAAFLAQLDQLKNSIGKGVRCDAAG